MTVQLCGVDLKTQTCVIKWVSINSQWPLKARRYTPRSLPASWELWWTNNTYTFIDAYCGFLGHWPADWRWLQSHIKDGFGWWGMCHQKADSLPLSVFPVSGVFSVTLLAREIAYLAYASHSGTQKQIISCRKAKACSREYQMFWRYVAIKQENTGFVQWITQHTVGFKDTYSIFVLDPTEKILTAMPRWISILSKHSI